MSLQITYSDATRIESDPTLSRIASSLESYFSLAQRMLERVGLGRVLYNLKVLAIPGSSSGNVVATYDEGKDILEIYLLPLERNSRRAHSIIIHECGHRYWNNFLTGGKKQVWSNKYVKASSRAVSEINQAAWTRQWSSYESFVTSFSDANTRLIALHFANALIANKHPIQLIGRVDFMKHPATRDMATGRRMFSITPLISEYATKDVYEDFSETFRLYVDSGGTLNQISDSRGREMLRFIFERTIF